MVCLKTLAFYHVQNTRIHYVDKFRVFSIKPGGMYSSHWAFKGLIYYTPTNALLYCDSLKSLH